MQCQFSDASGLKVSRDRRDLLQQQDERKQSITLVFLAITGDSVCYYIGPRLSMTSTARAIKKSC